MGMQRHRCQHFASHSLLHRTRTLKYKRVESLERSPDHAASSELLPVRLSARFLSNSTGLPRRLFPCRPGGGAFWKASVCLMIATTALLHMAGSAIWGCPDIDNHSYQRPRKKIGGGH